MFKGVREGFAVEHWLVGLANVLQCGQGLEEELTLSINLVPIVAGPLKTFLMQLIVMSLIDYLQ